VALLISADGDTLFGVPPTIDDVIWSGPQARLEELAAAAGLERVRPLGELAAAVASVRSTGGAIHYLPPFRDGTVLWLADLLEVSPAEIRRGASMELVRAMVDARIHKDADEVAEIEEALSLTARMFEVAMRVTRAGMSESDVAGAAQAVALARERDQAYLPIVTVRGEVLHNESQGHTLEEGQLLLMDAGTESAGYYASDITRTWPVSGRFDERQRHVYEVVLRAQQEAIGAIGPGVPYRDIHLQAARTMTEGLAELGLMRGAAADAVAAGAHALFFPHGLGHMLGLDVHDMEDLGEDNVGYGPGFARSEQFGTRALRLARPLEPGFVLTVEPGLYFIPGLIDAWRRENRHAEYLDYDAIDAMRGFGGIRIEDNVLVTDHGHRVLGPPIPKTVADVEAALAG
jgi:Xaa-Pro aminopeptidase